MKSLHDDRKEYLQGSLLESQVPASPWSLFDAWFEQHRNESPVDATAMTVATVWKDQPSARTVLLKSYSESGLEFFTNYSSDKGRALLENPKVALHFFWPERERQVRVEGKVEFLSSEENDRYFDSRPLESRVGAVASDQSKSVSSREELEQRFKALLDIAKIEGIKRPENWGGYRVIPHRWEFWQGRSGRLHDRLVYSLRSNTQLHWEIQRLNP